MSLAPGDRLGAYQIVALIGSGGMGEVYRARDTRLKREVAIKSLPDAFAKDPDRLARFQREAELLATLSHPNIAAVFGLEQADGTNAIVLELVEGETLADRIARGPLPLDEALPIAKQIAEALEAAHDRGVIHRDLKPANVKITPDGKVKVLDFGLAKMLETETSGSALSMSPTLSLQGTHAGVILGTAAYMSPEQARGKPVDRRTDIWSFGCVLFEMLTGRTTFDVGDTVSDAVASILKNDPDWSALPADTPAHVRALLRRCLQKDVQKRLPHIGVARLEIEEGPSESVVAKKQDAPTVKQPLWRRATLTAGVVLIVAVIAAAAGFYARPVPRETPAIARMAIPVPAAVQLASSGNPALAISASGTLIAYVGAEPGRQQQLYLRTLESIDSRAVSGTEGATNPFFSPDGQWIGFFAQGKLKRVSVDAGAIQTVCNAPNPRGGSWAPDNTIYFTPSNLGGLWKVPASGGTPEEVTRLDRNKGEISHRWPQLLPGGKALLFTVWTGPGLDEKQIHVQSLETAERRLLVQGGDTGRYISTGHLVYARADALMAVPMDLARLEVTGAAPASLADVVRVGGEGAQYAVSDLGELVYWPGDPRRYERRLVWVDRNGRVEPLPAPVREYSSAKISPDGLQAAVEIQGGTPGVWLYDFSRATLTPLTTGPSSQNPIWTADGKHVVYRGTRMGVRSVFWKAVDGGSEEERLTTKQDVMQTPAAVSTDGKWLFFIETDPSTGGNIWALRLDAGRKPQALLTSRFAEGNPSLSPDGRWLAYSSNESGRGEIYVQPFPGPGGKRLISTEGGEHPMWSRNGRELFYESGDRLMVVDIATQPVLTAGPPRLLIRGRFEPNPAGGRGYDLSPDGQRFLRVQAIVPEQPATHINVVMNWFEELKRRVPAN